MKNTLPFIQPDFFKNKEIHSYESIAGGDINKAWQITTEDQIYFLKENKQPPVLDFLSIEKRGLALLEESKTIKIPKTFEAGHHEGTAYLIMEYIPPVSPEKIGWENLGRQLAELHKKTAKHFGLDHANFIGSFPQTNHQQSTWSEFYVLERLIPQVKMARDQQLLDAKDLKGVEKLYKEIPNICPEEPPSLTHGDLWSGNFLITTDQIPVLIDPAVSYAHREMDLAMTQLFGGFDSIFYDTYQSTFPLTPGFSNRTDLYQFYYLLVHLNLFGRGYLSRVRAVIQLYI